MNILKTILLLSTLSLLGAGDDEGKWKIALLQNGKSQISVRGAISAPPQAGFARLIVEKGVGPKGRFKVIFLIESPNSLEAFPFNKFEGPIEKSKDDFMTLSEVGSHPEKVIRCVPNGGFVGVDHTGFQFSSVSPQLISFLKELHEPSKLRVTIHSSSSKEIQFECVTEGLKSGMQTLTK